MYDGYYYEYDPSVAYSDPAATAATLLILGVVYFFAFAITYVIHALLLSQIFHKAGVARWVAWVPFYNSWKMLEIGGQQGFWAVLTLVPLVNIASVVFTYISMYYIGLKLGKSGPFLLLGIFLPVVWLAILGLDSSKWDEKKAPQAPRLS